MQKVALIAALLIILALILGFYPIQVEKPVVDGIGPMAIRMHPDLPAPPTHSPLDWWQTHHMDAVNQGHLTETDCLYCHEPETSCNNCHSYVGVKQITLVTD